MTKDFKSSTVHQIRLRNIRAGTPAKVLRMGSRCSKYLPWISIDHSPKKQLPSHPSHPRSLIFRHLRRFSLQRLMCLGSKRHIDWTAQLTVGCDPPSHQVLDHFNQKPTKVLEENLILRLNETLNDRWLRWFPSLVLVPPWPERSAACGSVSIGTAMAHPDGVVVVC